MTKFHHGDLDTDTIVITLENLVSVDYSVGDIIYVYVNLNMLSVRVTGDYIKEANRGGQYTYYLGCYSIEDIDVVNFSTTNEANYKVTLRCQITNDIPSI